MHLPSSVPHSFSVCSSDLDQVEQIYLRSIANAKILHLDDKRQFKFNLELLRFDKVSLISNSFNSGCKMEASLEEDDFRLVLAIQEPSYFSWPGSNSHTASTNQGLVINPGRKIKVERLKLSKTLVINTSYSILTKHLEALLNEPLRSPLRFSPTLDLASGAGAYLQRLIRSLCSDAYLNRSMLQQPGIKRGYDELILGTILSLPHNHSSLLQPDVNTANVPAIVRQAEEYMRSHYKETITIADLTKLCRCSRRTLFSSFKSARDYTPMAFLLEQRLQAVRRKLLEADPQLQNISEIAYECGFSHLGRFAEQYNNRFGELPSASLQPKR